MAVKRWEEKTKLEKEREAELEFLKSSNQTLTKKVRQLEERAESHDSEHAALATELVRTKVDNEGLNDRNESLGGQVEELRRVVETQTEEVEKRLRGEMDSLLKRNQDVHAANIRLEEEMSEMEKTLVETKMQHAEVCPPPNLYKASSLTPPSLSAQRLPRDSSPEMDRPPESPRLKEKEEYAPRPRSPPAVSLKHKTSPPCTSFFFFFFVFPIHQTKTTPFVILSTLARGAGHERRTGDAMLIDEMHNEKNENPDKRIMRASPFLPF